MTAIHIDIDDASLPRSGTAFFDCRRARVRAKNDTGFTVISISGEIDASNVDDVSHHVFGEGVIIGMSGSGDKTEALVRFRDVGEKRLLLSWAPLKKL